MILRRAALGFAHPGAVGPWLAVLLGLALDTLAIPPGPFPWLILVVDAPFLWLATEGAGRRWKRWTLLYGVLHFGLALRWLGHVHPVQVPAVGFFLGPVYVLAALALRWLDRRRVPWLLAAPTVLVLEEMLRTVWLGGMPWPTRSLSFAGSAPLVASCSLLGAYALSFLAGLGGALAARLPRALGAPRGERAARLGRLALGALLPAALAAGLAAAGTAALRRHDSRLASGEIGTTAPRVLVAVQGNIPQDLKHGAVDGNLLLGPHEDLTRSALAGLGEGERLAVLWPETMIPWPFLEPDVARRFPDAWLNQVRIVRRMRDLVPEGRGLAWLVGAIHLFRRGDEQHDDLWSYGTHDSLFFVDPDAAAPGAEEPWPVPEPGSPLPWERGRHDKRVLVPGGEYTPLGDLIPPLRLFRNLVSEIPELDAGDADQAPLTLGHLPGGGPPEERELRAGTVICFEVAFPACCRAWRRGGAQVLLNPANYGWFKESGFRSQIRAVASLRAAETATTVVMAGNTGPTLFFDPVGRPYGRFFAEEGEVEAPVGSDATTHRRGWAVGVLLADPRTTPYVRWGDLPWGAVALLALLLALGRGPAGGPAGEAAGGRGERLRGGPGRRENL